MKKNTTVWIMVGKDGRPIGDDVRASMFLVKAEATKIAKRWNRDPLPGDLSPYTIRRATLVLQDPA
jgi:hypothetical protein